MHNIKDDIGKIIEDKINNGYRLAIYGAGENCTNVISMIKDFNDNIKIDFIIDKDEKKVGSKINDIEIINLDSFFELKGNYVVVYSLVKMNYFEEVRKELSKGNSNTVTVAYSKSLMHNMLIKRDIDEELDKLYRAMYFDGEIIEQGKEIQLSYLNGEMKVCDISSETINVINNERVVVGSDFEHDEQTKKITMFGDSRFFNGTYDKYTVPSFLQKQLGTKYCVKNVTLSAMQLYEVSRKIRKMKFAKDEIVILSNLMYCSNSKEVLENLGERQIAFCYMQEVLKIKRYFDNLGVKLIFVWLPSINEVTSHGKYEKEILNVMEGIDNFEYYKIGERRVFPNVEFIKEICNAKALTLCNLIDIFNYKNFDIYIDNIHFGDRANELIANYISKSIELVDYDFDFVDDIWYNEVDLFSKKIRINPNVYEGDIIKNIENLKTLRNDKLNNVGAIVMNANPFTKGHQYLVETAASQVEHLYVFVVEEDKSYFKFKDRIELVKLGTKHLDNVTVLPSGKGIISSITMPEYFTKESETTQIIDASTDIDIFALLIAPILKISKRFVGDEPFCNTTRQYNAQMKERLSEYGIELVILDRVGVAGNCASSAENEIISATKVRAYLQDKDFESLEKFVPNTTLKFLMSFEI